jgi:hypothetical protein
VAEHRPEEPERGVREEAINMTCEFLCEMSLDELLHFVQWASQALGEELLHERIAQQLAKRRQQERALQGKSHSPGDS